MNAATPYGTGSSLVAGLAACDGCRRQRFVLRVVDDAKLCEGCAEKSAEIDRKLAIIRSEDPVDCDGCGDNIDFDARVAVVVLECGGKVFCDFCKSSSLGSAAS